MLCIPYKRTVMKIVSLNVLCEVPFSHNDLRANFIEHSSSFQFVAITALTKDLIFISSNVSPGFCCPKQKSF